MKKVFSYLFCFIMIVCGACGFSQVMQKAYADDDLTITKVTLNIFNSDKTTVPQTKEDDNNTYLAEYQKNNVPHYPSFYLQATILTDPSDAVVDDSVSSQMKWFVDGVEIDFSGNSTIDGQEYSIVGDTYLGVYFTPKLPDSFVLLCKLTYNGKIYESSKIYLESEYAVPTSIEISTSGGNTTQVFENFKDIILTAKLTPEDFIDKSPNAFTYTWFKNSPDDANIVGNSAVFTVTKEILGNKIGETIFYVRVTGDQITGEALQKTITIKLTTESAYKITVSASSDNLVQKLEDNKIITPIQLTAKIEPEPEKYTINWYVLKMDSATYEKQKNTEKNYTLNLTGSKAGEYKVFARLTITIDKNNKEEVLSNIITATIQPKEVEFPKYDETLIKQTVHNVDSTGVQGFTLTIDVNLDEYSISENDIVWYVNGGKITNSNGSSSNGTQFTFNPPVAGEYNITVKVRQKNGLLAQWAFFSVVSKSTTVNLMWLYISLAIVLLITICVLSIIISNKFREKIW